MLMPQGRRIDGSDDIGTRTKGEPIRNRRRQGRGRAWNLEGASGSKQDQRRKGTSGGLHPPVGGGPPPPPTPPTFTGPPHHSRRKMIVLGSRHSTMLS